MVFQDGGGVYEIAALALAAVGLDGAEIVEGPLEIAGKASAVECEGGEGWDQELGVGERGRYASDWS